MVWALWNPTWELGIITQAKKQSFLSSFSPSLCLVWYWFISMDCLLPRTVWSSHLSIHPSTLSIRAYIELYCTPDTELGMCDSAINKRLFQSSGSYGRGKQTGSQWPHREGSTWCRWKTKVFKLVASNWWIYLWNSSLKYILFSLQSILKMGTPYIKFLIFKFSWKIMWSGNLELPFWHRDNH